MAGVSLLAWQNWVKTAATLTASAANPALPVTNLQNDQGSPSMAWQTPAGVLTGVLLTIVPPARSIFRAIGVFRTNLTGAAVVTYSLYNNPSTLIFQTTGSVVTPGQSVLVLAADTAADYVTIQFDDAANTDNFLNIPLVYCGPAWQPLTAMSWQTTLGRDDLTDTLQSRGGQTWINNRAINRRWEIAMDGIRASELYPQLDALDQYSRAGSNALVIPDLTSVNVTNDAMFGILKATADVGWTYSSVDRRSWRARLTERL